MSTRLNRRNFCKLTGLGMICGLSSCTSTQNKSKNPRSGNPNIVYILADDMGYGDLSSLNEDSKINTPNMDSIVKQGIHFTDAHSPSAVCTPTRYGILTGRYCWRSRLKKGVLGGYSPSLIEEGRKTVGSVLKEVGYRTACIGKWHLGLGKAPKTDFTKPLRPGPLDFGFDYFFGIPASLDMDPYCYIEQDHPLVMPTLTIEKGQRGKEGFYRAGPIAPGFKHSEVLHTLTKRAVDYIDIHTEKYSNQPFFLYFPLTAPHTPWVPTEAFKGKSRAGRYGDFVTQVDWTVGQVLKALDENKIADNTLIIVTSDNGSHEQYIGKEYNHEANYIYLGQKSDVWDGGHRIPFIARWPGRIKPGTKSDQTICLTDLVATASAIVGKRLTPDMAEDSYNILGALLGKQTDAPIREATIHHSISGQFAIRHGKWKLILCKGSGGWSKRKGDNDPDAPPFQLYDMENDPGETRNLYNEKSDIVYKLTVLLDKYKTQGYSRPM